jgi:type IV pilus assembly protein PilC
MSAETNEEMKVILRSILEDINEWKSLWYAVSCHPYFFWVSEIELIKAAEKMWNLPEVLRDIATELENSQKLKAKIKKAMMYPLWLFWFTIIAVWILLVFVIPTMVNLYWDPEKLPWITKFMISASDIVAAYRRIFILSVISFILIFSYLYKNVLEFKKWIDNILLKLPKIKDVILTSYMYKFSKLYWDFGKAWVSPTDALSQLMKIFWNYYYKRKMLSIKTDLENWFTISDSIEWSSLFDPILIQIIVVGEKTWNLSPILLTMSKFYHYQLNQKIDWLTAMIEPAMMWFIAAVIWSVVASIFLPLWGLLDVIWQ